MRKKMHDNATTELHKCAAESSVKQWDIKTNGS